MAATTFKDYTPQQGPFRIGDVVHADGACAILGDVTHVEQDGDENDQLVTVVWRQTETEEQSCDLYLKERKA